VRREGTRLSVVYDATDEAGAPIDLLTVPATVYGPDGEPERIRLRQTGPGRYAGEVAAARAGNYIAIARPSLGGTPLPPLLSGTTVAQNAEYARLSTDTRTLERIARAGGGRVLGAESGADLFDRSLVEPRRTRTPLWPVLLGWTVGVFLLDVGTRRVAWDRLLGERGEGVEAARAVAGERVAALRGAKRAATSRSRDGAAALSDKDAEKLRRDARARRFRQQDEELRRLRAREAAAPKSAPPPDKPRPTKDAESGEPESGLLAAKRRARQRFEEDGDGGAT
jgi:hypothetical protein